VDWHVMPACQRSLTGVRGVRDHNHCLQRWQGANARSTNVPEDGVLQTACDAAYCPAISGKGCRRATALHTPVLWSQMFAYDLEDCLRHLVSYSPAAFEGLYVG